MFDKNNRGVYRFLFNNKKFLTFYLRKEINNLERVERGRKNLTLSYEIFGTNVLGFLENNAYSSMIISNYNTITYFPTYYKY